MILSGGHTPLHPNNGHKGRPPVFNRPCTSPLSMLFLPWGRNEGNPSSESHPASRSVKCGHVCFFSCCAVPQAIRLFSGHLKVIATKISTLYLFRVLTVQFGNKKRRQAVSLHEWSEMKSCGLKDNTLSFSMIPFPNSNAPH